MKQLQHGDVLIQEVKELPEGCREITRDHGRLILARGEFTGHNHVITAEPATLYELKSELYLEVTEPVVITHEEHKPMTVPTGIYKIGQVLEYDYFAEMKRIVRD